MNKKIRRGYGVFFLVLTVLLGCAFLLQATDIYFGALEARENARAEVLAQAEAEGWSDTVTELKVAVAVNAIPIYSRQIVGQRLKKLLPYMCLWLAALIGSIVIAVISPLSPASRRDPELMLDEKVKAARRRIPEQPRAGQEETFEAAVAQCVQIRRQSRIMTVAVAVFAVACLILPFLYFADFSHFPKDDITAEVKAAALYALPFVAVLLAGGIAYVSVQHRMLKKESAAIRAAVAAGERKAKAEAKKKGPWLLVARIALLVIGLGLTILGTQNGSMEDVLVKAINICTECIGLG